MWRVGRRPEATRSPARQLPVEEVAHEPRDLLAFVFEREVAGIEQVQLGFGQVAQVGVCAVGGEDLVVLAPDDQRRRLALAEERLEARVQRDVGARSP